MVPADIESSMKEGGAMAVATEASGNTRSIFINDSDKNGQMKYISNYIRTTKYTIFSFLPLGLLYQFFRFSNCYFLFVTIL